MTCSTCFASSISSWAQNANVIPDTVTLCRRLWTAIIMPTIHLAETLTAQSFTPSFLAIPIVTCALESINESSILSFVFSAKVARSHAMCPDSPKQIARTFFDCHHLIE